MKKFGRIYTVLIFVFLYAPILLLVVSSFNSSKNISVFEDFTFKWYDDLFHNEHLLTLLLHTVVIAVLASVISTVVGTMAAVGISKMKKKMQNAIMMVTNVPMTNPDIEIGRASCRERV